MSAIATIGPRNVREFTPYARAGGPTTRIRAESNGPRSCPRVYWSEFVAVASTSSSRSTRAGSMVTNAGFANAQAVFTRNAFAIRISGVTRPSPASAVRTIVNPMAIACVTMMIRRRSIRSDATPPQSPNRRIGRKVAALRTPTMRAELVRM